MRARLEAFHDSFSLKMEDGGSGVGDKSSSFSLGDASFVLGEGQKEPILALYSSIDIPMMVFGDFDGDVSYFKL